MQSNLYPEPYCSEFKKLFIEYAEARLNFQEAGTDFKKITESKKKSDAAGKNLYNLASKLFQDEKFINASRIMAPSLNSMMNASSAREASLKSKVPIVIPVMILIIIIAIFYNSGFGLVSFRKKEMLLAVSYALIITLVTYIIFDLDRPDSGLIKPTVEYNQLIDFKNELNNGI